MVNRFPTGYMPDPEPTGRPWDALNINTPTDTASIPPVLDYQPDQDMLGFLYQVKTGSCVVQATVSAVRTLYYWDGWVSPPTMSRQVLYHTARAKIGKQNDPSAGLYPGMAFETFNEVGVCLESICPWDEDKASDPLPVSVLDSMIDQAKGADENQEDWLHHYDIPSDELAFDRVCEALSHKIPVVAGFLLDQAFMDLQYPDAAWWYNGPAVGRHYMQIVGYDRPMRTIKVKNSWPRASSPGAGDGWVSTGYCTIMASMLADPYQVTDIKAVTASRLPSELGEGTVGADR